MLKEICESPKHRLTPVVVITGHGLDSWELATDVMRDGARDFVAKPFANAGERTLERRIVTALESPPPVAAATPAGCETMCPFEYGDLDFYPSRVELCGVPVVTGTPIMRAVLEILSKRGANGEYVRRSGAQLASESGCAGGESGVGSAIRSFRSTVERKLREVNLLCDAKVDILVNDRTYGYHLTDKIMARIAMDPDSTPAPTPATPGDETTDCVSSLDDRKAWIIESLEAGRPMSARIIHEQFGCSISTAKRLIDQLKADRVIHFKGSPRTGRWSVNEPAPEAG